MASLHDKTTHPVTGTNCLSTRQNDFFTERFTQSPHIHTYMHLTTPPPISQLVSCILVCLLPRRLLFRLLLLLVERLSALKDGKCPSFLRSCCCCYRIYLLPSCRQPSPRPLTLTLPLSAVCARAWSQQLLQSF